MLITNSVKDYWTICDLYRWAVKNGVEYLPLALYNPEDDKTENLIGVEHIKDLLVLTNVEVQ